MKARHVITRVMQNAPDPKPVHLTHSLLQNNERARVKEKGEKLRERERKRGRKREKKKDREEKRRRREPRGAIAAALAAIPYDYYNTLLFGVIATQRGIE